MIRRRWLAPACTLVGVGFVFTSLSLGVAHAFLANWPRLWFVLTVLLLLVFASFVVVLAAVSFAEAFHQKFQVGDGGDDDPDEEEADEAETLAPQKPATRELIQ